MSRIAAMSLLMVASPAMAGVSGWVWNDCPTTSCTTSSLYQDNSSGGSNFTTRLSAGYYEVTFPGIASAGGNAQVTAYSTNGSCQIESWYPSGADQLVYVACYDAVGNPADTMFDLLFYDHGTWTAPNPIESAYAWSDLANPLTKHYLPASYRYNSAGGRISVTKVTTGTYDVMVPNMRKRGIVPMVTAYGYTPARCAALDWFAQGNGLAVRVECTDTNGSLMDTQFSFAVTAGSPPANADTNLPFLGAGLSVDGFGLLNTTESWYDVPGYLDSDVTVLRSSPGEFDVTLPGLAPYYDTFLVTAQPSAIGTRCNVGYWYSTGYDTVLHVDCYDGLGNAYDAGFTVVWQTSTL
jgi:hypothetical protein